jgi:hypothetical protein
MANKHVVVPKELHSKILQISKTSGKTMAKVIEEGVFGDFKKFLTHIEGMKMCYAQISEEYEGEIRMKAEAKLEVIEKILDDVKELGGVNNEERV